MSDKKISQLTASSTPLAGTEVVPIVQSNATKKVSVADLTAGRTVNTGALNVSGVQTVTGSVRGELKVKGSYAGGTDIGKIQFLNDSNVVVGMVLAENTTGGASDSSKVTIYSTSAGTAREVAAFEADRDLALAAGNLVLGTAGKGIDFSANTHAAGMTSELLNDYEEGTFTPDIFFGDSEVGDFTIVRQAGRYTKIGRMVYVKVYLEWSAAPTGGQILRFNLPFTALNTGGVYNPDGLYPGEHTGTFSDVIGGAVVLGNNALAQLFKATAGTTSFYNYLEIPASGNMLFSGVYEAA